MTKTAELTGIALLERALELSGMSLRAFAEDCLARDERSVRRWRGGGSPVAKAAERWMTRFVREQEAKLAKEGRR